MQFTDLHFFRVFYWQFISLLWCFMFTPFFMIPLSVHCYLLVRVHCFLFQPFRFILAGKDLRGLSSQKVRLVWSTNVLVGSSHGQVGLAIMVSRWVRPLHLLWGLGYGCHSGALVLLGRLDAWALHSSGGPWPSSLFGMASSCVPCSGRVTNWAKQSLLVMWGHSLCSLAWCCLWLESANGQSCMLGSLLGVLVSKAALSHSSGSLVMWDQILCSTFGKVFYFHFYLSPNIF